MNGQKKERVGDEEKVNGKGELSYRERSRLTRRVGKGRKKGLTNSEF